jgi:hypothetical protein
MRTEELVQLLAGQAEAVDPRAPARHMAWALVLAIGAGLALTGGVLGFNPNLAQDTHLPMFWAKQAFCAALAAAAGLVALRLARPGRRPGAAFGAIALPLLALWTLAGVVFYLAPPAQRSTLLLGNTALVCPWLIALVSAPAFIGFFWLMRGLAPTRLGAAGAAAGLAAGALGAWIYALHCPEYAAPFLGLWYVLGIAIPTGLGAVLGPRLLRW